MSHKLQNRQTYRPPSKSEVVVRQAILKVVEAYQADYQLDHVPYAQHGLFVERVIANFEYLLRDLDEIKKGWKLLDEADKEMLGQLKAIVSITLTDGREKLSKYTVRTQVGRSIPCKIRDEIRDKIMIEIIENLNIAGGKIIKFNP